MARPFKKEKTHFVGIRIPESSYLELQKMAEAVGLACTSYCTMLVIMALKPGK
jgi:hypothetical protein